MVDLGLVDHERDEDGVAVGEIGQGNRDVGRKGRDQAGGNPGGGRKNDSVGWMGPTFGAHEPPGAVAFEAEDGLAGANLLTEFGPERVDDAAIPAFEAVEDWSAGGGLSPVHLRSERVSKRAAGLCRLGELRRTGIDRQAVGVPRVDTPE